MKTIRLVIVLVLLRGVVAASPIEEVIDTPEQLKAAQVEIRCFRSKEDATFKIEWTPAKEERDPVFPPGLWFIQTKGEAEEGLPWKLQVRYQLGSNGRCEADFTLRTADLADSHLIFILSQQTQYVLKLSDYVRFAKIPVGE